MDSAPSVDDAGDGDRTSHGDGGATDSEAAGTDGGVPDLTVPAADAGAPDSGAGGADAGATDGTVLAADAGAPNVGASGADAGAPDRASHPADAGAGEARDSGAAPDAPAPCAAANGGCGDPRYYSCTNQPGAPPQCAVIDQCAANNGGCGDPRYYSCTSQPGAPPQCAVIDQCAANNGGCGPVAVFSCTNNPGQPPTCEERSVISAASSSLTGIVTGLQPGAQAKVILGNDGYLAAQTVTGGQQYRFEDVPDGTYFLKLDVVGHTAGKAKTVVVAAAAPAPAARGIGDAAEGAEPTAIDLTTTTLTNDTFSFHWEEDASRAGQNQTAYVNQPPVIEFLGQEVPVPDIVASDHLAHDYNVILSDQGKPWNQEHAYRLLETLKMIPQRVRWPAGGQDLKPSKWILTQDNLAGDVQIDYGADGNTVTIAEAVFTYAAPRMVVLDGVRGTFFSKRLHHALVRYVTQNGTDLAAAEKILKERYGCTTVIPDYEALTAPTTAETAASFQAFHPYELVLLINMFEEMPHGYRSVPGLKYLVRRRDGEVHPWYPAAPAVAWALPGLFPNGSYIELMEGGFTADPDDVHRLILHEKAHFLWGYLFSEELKQDWADLGGWYPDPESLSGWSTTQQTEFVSAYAHSKNPNEDMAESLAYFILNPDALRSRAPAKFAFVRDRVMHGDRYVSTIPEALTFQVLNLYPDYTYPGKIRRVDVRVDGAPDQDKQVTVEIELNTLQNVFAGASNAYLRLFSPIGTFTDVWLGPTNAQGSILRGGVTISKYAKSGLWRPDQIVINDPVGNQRMEGVHDFGWRLLVNNPLEDLIAPRYVPNTLQVAVVNDTVTEADGAHPVYRVHVTWLVNENCAMPPGASVHASLANPAAYSHGSWGTVAPTTWQAAVDILITDFDANGLYGVPAIFMVDAAGNMRWENFKDAPGHEPETFVNIDTKTPDSRPPEVSLNDVPAEGLHRILVSAYPTHPEAPDGETVVTVRYQARDDRSGVGFASYRLLDPQGLSHFQYHYHDNFHSLFFQGDPTQWKDYAINALLPVGSPPGTWGLQELVLRDKAGNQLDLNFVETMHFEVPH